MKPTTSKMKTTGMMNVRTLVDICKHSGLGSFTAVFVFLFALCSVVVWLADPSKNTLGDGVWFCFQVVSTIGFGDVEASAAAARTVSVVLSIVSIFYIAIITGVVVSYVNEMLKLKRGDELAQFADNLSRIDTMTPEELAEFAANVRAYRRKHEK